MRAMTSGHSATLGPTLCVMEGDREEVQRSGTYSTPVGGELPEGGDSASSKVLIIININTELLETQR